MAGSAQWCTPSQEFLLPPPIREDHRAPAAAIEFLPLAFRLRQAVGDCIDRCRMVAQGEVAAIDLHILDLRAGLVEAGLPGRDAVGAGEDSGGRHRRSVGARPAAELATVI